MRGGTRYNLNMVSFGERKVVAAEKVEPRVEYCALKARQEARCDSEDYGG